MMRKAIFAAILAALSLIQGRAATGEEGKGPGEEGPPELSEKYFEALNERLELTEDQRKKIKAVLDKKSPGARKNWEKLRQLRKEMQDLGAELKKGMLETQEAIREELTLEQREKFDEMRARMRRGPGRGRKGQGGSGMRGVEFDSEELPPELRERMKRRRSGLEPGEIPPDRWEEGEGMPGRRDLPPELRERIEERIRRRREMPEGSQRDVPPSEEWNDRKRMPRMPREDGPEEEIETED